MQTHDSQDPISLAPVSITDNESPRKNIKLGLSFSAAKDWVERVEYEDYVEYREVPVDKIIEVPMEASGCVFLVKSACKKLSSYHVQFCFLLG